MKFIIVDYLQEILLRYYHKIFSLMKLLLFSERIVSPIEKVRFPSHEPKNQF